MAATLEEKFRISARPCNILYVFNIYFVASRHPNFRFLFFPGLDQKWSRDTDIWFLTLQEN